MFPDRQPRSIPATGETMSDRKESSSSSGTNLATQTSAATSLMSPTSSCPEKPKDFKQSYGRLYLDRPGIPYGLPVDLEEMHRQTLWTLAAMEIHGGPVGSPYAKKNPPTRVLDVGCGCGVWSMLCHRYFRDRGYPNIEFVGLDVIPASYFDDLTCIRPDEDMNWTYVEHNLLDFPWPFEDQSFDLVLEKDLGPGLLIAKLQCLADENLRLLREGGTLEVWERDQALRKLDRHVPQPGPETDAALEAGAYPISLLTPFSPAANPYVADVAVWADNAFTGLGIMTNPCTTVNYMFVQEEGLFDVHLRRLAIPLGQPWWEREGIGGKPSSQDGGKGQSPSQDNGELPPPRRSKPSGEARGKLGSDVYQGLTERQAAVRHATLMTFLGSVQGGENVLRPWSGKKKNEWDMWVDRMIRNLTVEGGTSSGEALEIGVWWARRKAWD